MKVRLLSPCEKGDRWTEMIGPRYPLRMGVEESGQRCGHGCTFSYFLALESKRDTPTRSCGCQAVQDPRCRCSCALPVFCPNPL